MKSHAQLALVCIILAAFALSACGAPAPAPQPAPRGAMPTVAAGSLYGGQVQESGAPQAQNSGAMPAGPAAMPAIAGAPAATPVSSLPDSATVQTGTESLTGVQSDRMIIKNAELKLLVDKTDNAIDRSMQVVSDAGGYIISSRTWYQDANDEKYKFATLTIGVPVDQFETAMRRLRSLAMRVLDENASGQDVSGEYVDLQSQLGNLEATRDRIRAFLADAKTIEESLRINQELTNIEAQIEQVKGRMNFLANRSAYSTITVNFEPDIPPLTPTPTPTLMPTPTPKPWNPGDTLHKATDSVTSIYQGFVELAIWLFVVILPLLAPPALIIWALYKLVNRKSKKVEPEK